MAISLTTEDKLEYQFHPCSSGQIQFRVKSPNDAHVALTHAPNESEPIYEVFIGGWSNSKSVIRKNRTKPEIVETETPGILNENEFCGFWIRWQPGVITVGKEGEHSPFLTAEDYEISPFTYFGVCTGWGASGEWLIEDPNMQDTAPSAPIQASGNTAGICWSDASGGILPENAVEGGRDDEPLYIGRANHAGALIPGKVKPSHGVCYVAWGGEEHAKPDYQVLCGCQPQWVPTSGGNIPANAIPAGETEDGEPLFVGRVNHEGSLTIGKVQASHNVCYIAYGGSEVSFPDYEVLVGQ